jgi:type III secretory pathway component EscS
VLLLGLLAEAWRSSIAFSLPGLAAIGTDTIPLQAAAKRLSCLVLVTAVDALCAVATLPSLFSAATQANLPTLPLWLKLVSVLINTAAGGVCVHLLLRAGAETSTSLLYYLPAVAVSGSVGNVIPSPPSGSVLHNGVLVPRGSAVPRPNRSPNTTLPGEGRRLGTV